MSRVRILYETGMRGGARSERVVEPYHLQRYGRFWILIAYDHLRKEVRDFMRLKKSAESSVQHWAAPMVLNSNEFIYIN